MGVGIMEKYKLTEDESLMEAWVDGTHGCRHMPWRDYLLFWSDAKEQFLTKLFNNQLIHKFDITLSKSEHDINLEMDSNDSFRTRFDLCYSSFREVICSFLTNRYNIEYKAAISIFSECTYAYNDYTRAMNILADKVESAPENPTEVNLIFNLGGLIEHFSRHLFCFYSLAKKSMRLYHRFQNP